MERQLHRLEKLIVDKEEVIKSLTVTNRQLEMELGAARKQIQQLKEKAIQNFSYRNVPDREIIRTLQAKVASSAWQIVQLQNLNSKYGESILKLQSEILACQQEVNVSRNQIMERNANMEKDQLNQIEISEVFKEWEDTLREKDVLIQENLRLKEAFKGKQAEIAEKMAFYLSQVENLGAKIRNQHQSQKSKLAQFESALKQLKKQNETLREALAKKNEQVLLFYQQTKMITTTKAQDLHTIRNLRAQLKKKSDQYFKILSKLNETEELKTKLMKYNTEYSECIGEFNRLSEKFEEIKRQNGILKQKLEVSNKKLKASGAILEEANKKLYEILVENEACHQLLYESRGYSNLFQKDVEIKVERFLQSLEKRRQNLESWLDVTELIAVNEKLRTKTLMNNGDGM